MILRGSLLGASVVLAGLVGLEACGSSKLAGPGGECFVATDCEAPLVCIPQKDNSRICTADLTRAIGTLPPDGGGPADAGDGGDAARGEGGSPTDGGTPVDSGEPKDSSAPKDSGPPADSGESDGGT